MSVQQLVLFPGVVSVGQTASGFYQNYMASAQWKFNSRLTVRLAKEICQICGDPSPRLSAHHNRYDTLGCEIPGRDLIALCPICHRLADRRREERRFHR